MDEEGPAFPTIPDRNIDELDVGVLCEETLETGLEIGNGLDGGDPGLREVRHDRGRELALVCANVDEMLGLNAHGLQPSDESQ